MYQCSRLKGNIKYNLLCTAAWNITRLKKVFIKPKKTQVGNNLFILWTKYVFLLFLDIEKAIPKPDTTRKTSTPHRPQWWKKSKKLPSKKRWWNNITHIIEIPMIYVLCCERNRVTSKSPCLNYWVNMCESQNLYVPLQSVCNQVQQWMRILIWNWWSLFFPVRWPNTLT